MPQEIPRQDLAFENDHLQFALVLKRIHDLGLLSPGKLDELAESLDYSEGEITDVMDRACEAVDCYMDAYYGTNSDD